MSELTAPAAESASATLLSMVNGYQLTQLLGVAATLGIADLLAEGPRSPSDLAAATETQASALYRVLRALASYGVFAEDETGRFALTPLAEPLRAEAPGAVRATLAFIGERWYRVWGELLFSVRSGESAFEHLFGVTSWQHRAQHPTENAYFNAVMARDAQQRGDAIVHAYQFPEGAMVADVGGGEGTLLARVLAANPSLRGVLIDQPHVVAMAPSVLQAAGVADRCTVQVGDFFAVLPPADVYMLSWILHDWSDADALRILERCREALRPNGSLLLVESIVPAGNGPHPSKMGDLTMLLFNGGGRERTAAEWRTLLAEAGFALQRVIPTTLPQSLLEARPLDRPA